MSASFRKWIALMLALVLGLGAPLSAFPATAESADHQAGMEQTHDCCADSSHQPCHCTHEDQGCRAHGACCGTLPVALPSQALRFGSAAAAPMIPTDCPCLPSPSPSGPFRPPRA